jgi:hypothetical protein
MNLKKVGLYSLEEDNTPHQMLTRAHLTSNLGMPFDLILVCSNSVYELEANSKAPQQNLFPQYLMNPNTHFKLRLGQPKVNYS